MEFQEFWKQKERMCGEQSTCETCPMNGMRFDYNNFCAKVIEKNPQQAEQIVEQWAKEHPVITNADKFREVFGVDIAIVSGLLNEEWLNQEYKEPEENS